MLLAVINLLVDELQQDITEDGKSTGLHLVRDGVGSWGLVEGLQLTPFGHSLS